MKNIITIILFTTSNVMLAQINFDNETVLLDESHIASDPTSLILVDLDNDSYKDLVITSYDDTIMWYKNVFGDFSHFPRKIISTQEVDIPSCIASGDLNNDGLKDIIAASSSAQDKIVWFQNLGNGNFSNEIIISNVINGPLTINVSDIDNDGDMDILTGGQDDTIILLENLNIGSFQNPITIYDGNSNTKKIKTVDINNDNLLDIISSHDNGAIYWAKNLGNNVYENKQYITGGSDDGTALDFIDVNEDGFLDIVTANNYSQDNVRYILNLNGISFDNNNSIIIDDTIQEPYEINAKDIDNDGKKDIVVSFWTNDNISWYKNLGNGVFSTKNLITDNINNPKSFIIDDVDNDYINDIISSSYSLSKVSLFKNHNTGNSFEEIIINYWYGFPKDVKTGDLNNDGNNDIIIACDDLIWLENHGNSSFSSYKLISSTDDNNPYLDLTVFDLDSNGDKDIIGLRNDGIEIFINLGNEIFSSTFFSYENLKGNMVLEDVDGDGYKDIIVIINDRDNGKVAWIKNNGDLSFGNISVFTDSSYGFRPNKITAGDIDNDGDIDIVVSSKSYSRIYLLENDGLGNLSNLLIMESVTTDAISLEDVDNDNYLDIISGGYYIGNFNLLWIKNNNGIFANNKTTISNNTGAMEFSFIDIDNNGYKDLFCVVNEYYDSILGQTMFYFLNDSLGFGNKTAIGNIQEYANDNRNIYIEDFNNDNKPDILTSYNSQKKVHLITNSSTLSIINEDIENFLFKLYPVPFTSKLHWSDYNGNNSFQIKIFDIMGKEIFFKNNFTQNEVDLNFLTNGVYIIHFKTPNGFEIKRKIIKE